MSKHYHSNMLSAFPKSRMAWRDVDSSFDGLCLTAGIGAV